MNDSKPIVYILHGDDHLGLMNFIDQVIGKMGDRATAQMNINRLQSGIDTDGDIRSSCMVMPFLSGRRLVILNGFSERLKTSDSEKISERNKFNYDLAHKEGILEFLNNIPQTTALLIVVEDEWVRDKGKWGWKNLPLNHWLITWVENNPGRALYREFSLPRGRDIVTWIMQHARKLNGEISQAAATTLSASVGNDTQLAHQELIKLLTYVGYERSVEIADVEALTAPAINQSIFDLVDNIGRRDGKSALDALHRLLIETSAEELMGMVFRQFRLLIIIKEALSTAMTITDICTIVRLPAGIVEKMINQVQRYHLDELKSIYQKLLDLDLSNKTSQMPPDVALDGFIVSLVTLPTSN